MYRYWINQPSTLQPLHKLHGTNVLGILERDGIMRIYFTARNERSGDIINQVCPVNCLSRGWV